MAINPREIHRLFRHNAVRAPGVKKQIQADLYINKRIDEHLAALSAEKILDLGCGSGGIMLDLAVARPDASYAGVTASRQDKQKGDDLSLRHGLQEQVRIFEADYTDPRVFRLFPDMDIIYAVESLSTRNKPIAIVPYIAESLKARGRFILCDYFLSKEKKTLSAEEKELFDQAGGGLETAPDWIGILEESGFETLSAEDFTPWVSGPGLFEKNRDDRKKILHKLIKQGLIQYRFLVFQKQTE